MKVTVTTDGEQVDHDVSLDFETLTLKQGVRLEKVMGADRCQRLLSGDAGLAMMPSTIQALIYVQIADKFPDLKIGDFDLDLADLALEDTPAEPEPVVIPMTLPDGVIVEGASDHVDPTREAVTG